MTNPAREPSVARLDPADGPQTLADDNEPIRLLIVDDIEDNRVVLGRRFVRRGFRVAEANCGRQALEWIERHEFDVVLLDINMPDMDGMEVLRKIREKWLMDALPVIMCTANHASEDIVHALDAGANDYVTKPVDLSVALARIQAQVERKRANAKLARARAALSTMNENLEGRVEERTRELAEINQRLELEIQRRQQADAKTQYLAYHDALTGLGNRVSFREVGERGLEAARLTGVPFAIFYIDLDGFKDVNDTLGHSVGDALLKSLATRLRDRLPEDVVIARLGGDEFGMLQSNCESVEVAIALANDILDIVAEPLQIEGNQLSLTASVGIAIGAKAHESIDDLLKSADLAMYRAKEDGRGEAGSGTYRIFDPTMDQAAQAALQLKLELRAALAKSEFELHFQPIVNVRDRRVSGFEALIRWRHPSRGLLAPTMFVPLAETTPYIVPIGEWVLRQACHDAMRWPDGIRVAVNLSPMQFLRGDIVATVVSALAQSQLPPNRLELEITETVLLEKSDRNIHTLENLRSLGVSISMDDFGTGFSSLSYLRTFPLDKLKIDKSFVESLSSDRRSFGIVSAIAGLGQTFGLKTVAEGVETDTQYQIVAKEGCTEVQGFFYAKPMAAEEIPHFIATFKPPGEA